MWFCIPSANLKCSIWFCTRFHTCTLVIGKVVDVEIENSFAFFKLVFPIVTMDHVYFYIKYNFKSSRQNKILSKTVLFWR